MKDYEKLYVLIFSLILRCKRFDPSLEQRNGFGRFCSALL